MMKTVNTTPPQTNNISWPDVYLTAEALQEPFEDVHILTLKSHLTEKAWEAAHNELGYDLGWSSVFMRVCDILDQRQVSSTEHVSVGKGGIRVVIDADDVNDDVVWQALDMVAVALERLNGSAGEVRFSSPIAYTTQDMTWLVPPR